MEFKKYRKVYRLGHEENKEILSRPNDEIVVQEKIDGGNFRIYILEGKVIFGSRTQELNEDNVNITSFKRCMDFVKDKLKDKDLSQYKGYIIYGECCIKRTINYDWDKMPPFLGFDIYDGEKYVEFEKVQNIFSELELPMVPLIGKFRSKDIPSPITDDFVPISKYCLASARDTKAEGIMLKNYSKQIFAKYVRDAFKEKNAEVFGGTPKYNKVDDTNNAEFIFKYCTNPRIEKLILKKMDEGKRLDMRLMGELIRDTYIDIIEEEWREILTSNWKIDFKKVRKLITPRVRNVLQQMMQNNVLLQKEDGC